MSFARSFPPITAPDAEILILGSMPGLVSLAADEYYAHPRNAFWPIMAELFGFDLAAPYNERVKALGAAKVAVWDVLYSCSRPGSLDSNIVSDSLIANDLASFLQQHPALKRVFFNGAKAESCFRKHIAPTLAAGSISYQRLASTSPAHAALTFAQKLAAWRTILVEGH